MTKLTFKMIQIIKAKRFKIMKILDYFFEKWPFQTLYKENFDKICNGFKKQFR